MKKVLAYQDKKVLVMGLAKSGRAAAQVLRTLGATVTINDKTPLHENEAAQEMVEAGFEVICGDHPLSLLDEGFDFIVKNPGIPYNKVPLLLEAQKRHIPILTEVELAAVISEAPFIGITGSNGKTTTTTLIFEMLKEDSKQPLIAGNIGEVATLVASDATKDQVLVTELSSFQLMGIQTFKPMISLLLNITEAHLDYHTDLTEYQQAKLRIMKNQTSSDYCVYNADDAVIVEGVASCEAQLIPFSLQTVVDGAYVQANTVFFKEEPIISVDEILLKGNHNLQDVLGAVAVCKLYGCRTEAMVTVLKRFTGVKHRLQYVKEIAGVRYYNNSKATNSIATETALEAFTVPTILLAGGLDRGHDLQGLVPYLTHVKHLLCYGETKERFAQLAREQHISYDVCQTLDEVVAKAHQLAVSGDVVLLSPACASWDQYKTFEQRGDHFITLVDALT